MTGDTPYSPETLAKRWGCSSRHIRNLITSGHIKAFRLGGKLLRIAAIEVARIEQGDNAKKPINWYAMIDADFAAKEARRRKPRR